MTGLLLALSTLAFADDPQQVVVTGRNVCIGCTLKKEQGAAAQCSIYGHRHGIEVTSATTAAGEELAALAGKTLHYLDNDASKDLVQGEGTHGQTVKVTARLFEDEALLEVASFSAE